MEKLVPCLVITQVFSDFFDVWIDDDEIRRNSAINVTPVTTEDTTYQESTGNPKRSGLKIMV